MANILGNTSTGFIESMTAKRAFASKFTAAASFTANWMRVNFSEEWGVGGTLCVAIYADNAGVPGVKLGEGETTYASSGSWRQVALDAGVSITNGNDYWLAFYLENSSGTFNVNAQTRQITADLKRWDEPTTGSWTDNPTTTNQATNRQLAITAQDVLEVTLFNRSDALLQVQQTLSHTLDALRQLVSTAVHTTDAFIKELVSTPDWVSPADTATEVQSDEPLVFTIPDSTYSKIHFHIQYDMVNTFDSVNLIEHKTWEDTTGWEYWNGSAWTTFPADGVANTYSGNNARYTPSDLLEGTWYRRIRAMSVEE